METRNTNTELDLFGGVNASQLKADAATKNTFGLAGVAASLLSDAQDLAHYGDHETARQFINRAKFYLFELQGRERDAGRAW